MKDVSFEAFEQLKNEVEELKEKLQKVEAEVEALKGTGHGVPAQQPVLNTHKGPVASTKKMDTIKQQVKKETIPFHQLLFQVWLPRVFILIFVIGVLWGLKAASNYGLLNSYTKVLLGYIATGALLWIGHQQVKKNRIAYGIALISGSIPVFMLTTFAAHQLYDMIGPTVAFLLLVMWIAVGMYLMNKYRSEVIGVVALIGGVLVPFLIENAYPNLTMLIIYEGILYVAFSVYGMKKNYLKLYYLATVILHFVYMIVCVIAMINGNLGEFYEMLILFFILFQHVVLLYHFVVNADMKQRIGVILYSHTIIVSGWILALLDGGFESIVLLFIIVLYVGLFVKTKDRLKHSLYATVVLYFMTVLIFLNVDEQWLMTMLILQAALTLFIGFSFQSVIQKIMSVLIALPVLGELFFPVESTLFSIDMFNQLLLLGYLLLSLKLVHRYLGQTENYRLLRNAIFAGIVPISLIITSNIANILDTGPNEPLSITVGWLVLAIIYVIIGRVKELHLSVYVGVGLIFLALAKFILVDISFVSLNIRALLFIVVGIIGLLISRMFYKTRK